MRQECPRACGVCKPGSKRGTGKKPPPAAPPPPRTARPPPPVAATKHNSLKANGAPECTDHDQRCAAWASAGRCSSNRALMARTCPLSCNTCADDPVAPQKRHNAAGINEDVAAGMAAWASQHVSQPQSIVCTDSKLAKSDCAAMLKADGACGTTFMKQNCRATCGLCDSSRAVGGRATVHAASGAARPKEEL